MYVKVNDLPAIVQAALESVGYGRDDIRVEPSEAVVLSSSSGDGQRAFATLVNLSDNTHATTWGSWGGANMFNPTNAVDMDDRRYVLPPNGLAITGSIGGGRPAYAVVHIPASMVDRMLPAPAAPLTSIEREALSCYKGLKSGPYRRDALQRAGATPAIIDSLVDRGLLKRNKAGATMITTDGKNAIDRH